MPYGSEVGREFQISFCYMQKHKTNKMLLTSTQLCLLIPWLLTHETTNKSVKNQFVWFHKDCKFQSHSRAGGGDCWKPVLSHARPEKHEKKVAVLRLDLIVKNSDWGSKCACFQEKVSFLDSIRGSSGYIFQTVLFYQMYPQWSCLWSKIQCKNQRKFLFRRCFSGKGQILIRVCFENLWSRTTLVFECPPPPAVG